MCDIKIDTVIHHIHHILHIHTNDAYTSYSITCSATSPWTWRCTAKKTTVPTSCPPRAAQAPPARHEGVRPKQLPVEVRKQGRIREVKFYSLDYTSLIGVYMDLYTRHTRLAVPRLSLRGLRAILYVPKTSYYIMLYAVCLTWVFRKIFLLSLVLLPYLYQYMLICSHNY
jgi:hypothetical protein